MEIQIQVHSASYREESIEEFRFNPLIEALPATIEFDEVGDYLMFRPSYEETDRQLSTSTRMNVTQRIALVHQPTEQEVDVYYRISRCIRWGYVGRNPLSPAYVAQLAAGYSASVNGSGLNYSAIYNPRTFGFSLLGVSGIGKTSAVEKILSLYPQVIKHELYHGYPINELQISWMKLDCTHDGSLKGICMEFFEMLDNLVGTEYYKQYTSPKVTLDTMIIGMSRLCISYNVGVLIIDEIQNLCSAKKDIPVRVLNFFVTLVNKIGVPVILIGTPKALSILQSDFQQAKRGSGQGDAMWHRLENGRSWNLLRQAIWEYQYTKKPVPFNDEMNDALYEESQGIPFLAVHIYKLVQEDAILSGRETFSAKDLHRIASEKMKLTEPMRNAMKLGKDVDLRKYVDITPFSYSDYKDNYSIAAESKTPAKEPPKVHSVQEAATVALTAFGISYAKASSCVCAALAEDKSGCPSSEIIARKAYDIYLSESTNAEVVSSPLSGLTGYDALKEAGVIADEIP